MLKNCWYLNWQKKRFSRASILLGDKKIVAVSGTHKTELQAGKSINLRGKYILPGFIDCHTHLIAMGIELQRTDLSRCTSLNQCLEHIHKDLKENNMVFAVNWDESNWPSYRPGLLNRRLLDKLSRKKPIIMRRVCGHLAVVNTPALKKIPKKTKTIDYKNGILYENAALYLNEVFKPDKEMCKKAINLGIDYALKNGITSVHEITNPESFQLLQQSKSHLKIRFSIYLPVRYINQITEAGFLSRLGDERLKFSGLKIFMDGSIGARTAALKNCYQKSRKRGKILVTQKRLSQLVSQAEKNGLQLMIHSIGDRATELVLKVFENTIPRKNPLRHRLEHIEILSPAMIEKIAKYHLIASMQPNFVHRWQGSKGMYQQHIGPAYEKMNCFRKLLDAGAYVVFGSDCMPMGPFYGIEGAIRHPSSYGRLRPIDAIRLYTKDAAYATFDEDILGAIEPGRLADLIVLDKNPLKVKDTKKIKVMMVIVDGRIVYQRGV